MNSPFKDFITYLEKERNETKKTAPPTSQSQSDDAANKNHEIDILGFTMTPFEGVIFLQLIFIWLILAVWLLNKMWKKFILAIANMKTRNFKRQRCCVSILHGMKFDN